MTYPNPRVTPGAGVPEVEQEPLHDHEFGVYCRIDCPRWGNPAPQPGWEQPRDWYFTFGANHTNPVTGESLGQSYVVINGTCDGSRAAMFEVFGSRWSMQYSSPERAGVVAYGLQHLPLPIAPRVADQRSEEMTLSELLDGLLTAAAEPDFEVETSCRDEIIRRFEEQSGGAAALRADVVTSVQREIETLRRETGAYGDACEAYGLRRYSSGDSAGAALRAVEAAWSAVTARLDQIAALVRGEQQ